MKILLLFISFFSLLNAQEFKVKSGIDSLLMELPSSTKTAVAIYNASEDDTVYSKNIFASMIPASNIKLFTTAAAIYHLGLDANILTIFYTDDSLFSENKSLGNLYVKGFGDPTITTYDLTAFADSLKKMGIDTVHGNIIADGTYFDTLYSREDWINNERTNVKVPPVSALTLDRNMLIVWVDANKNIGEKLGYEVYPKLSIYNVDMQAEVTSNYRIPYFRCNVTDAGINITVERGLKKRRWRRSYAVYIDNPALYFAMALKDILIERGITVLGRPETGTVPVFNFPIYKKNLEVFDFLSRINKESENYYAENLFKILGAVFSGEQGNSFYATQAVMTYLNDSKVDMEGSSIVDGSGISIYNGLTAASIIGLLKFIYLDPQTYNIYYNTLSIAGVDGTLEERFKNSPGYNNLHGKTGTLRGVSAISGYAKTISGKDVIVSILMEFNKKGLNYHREIQDKIVDLVLQKL